MKAVVHLDLVKLGKVLEAEKRHPKLTSAINRAAAVGSIREDLRAASAALLLINEMIAQSDKAPGLLPTDMRDSTLIGALFTQAVILYARATATTGDRPKLLGEAKLTSDQRKIHQEAVALRNSTIAHFGRGEELSEGPIVREAVLYSLFKSPTGPKNRVGVYTSRAQHKVAFASRLASLIDIRLGEILDRQQRIFDYADEALISALKTDPALGSSLPDFKFDPSAFCPSPEAAARMREQLETGEMEDMDFAISQPTP